MTLTITRRTDAGGEPLGLTREHELVAAPRKSAIDWAGFDASQFAPAHLEKARRLWQHRAFTEFHSLTHFTQLASQLQVLGAPLDWSGAMARMVTDEVRHVELCLRMVEALGGEANLKLADTHGVHLTVRGPLRAHVRRVVLEAFCVGETLSGRMFKRCLAACTVPLAREVVTAILVDETFHAELGWELAALLAREDDDARAERDALARALPGIFEEFARQCLVTRGPEWTRAQPEFDEGPGLGGLADAGFARAFFDGMEADVVPGLEAIGFPEARAAWAGFLETLPR